MTALLGLMWALERRSRVAGLDVLFKAVGAVCHDHQELVSDSGFAGSFCLTRNPIGKDGTTAAIVEEGRIHFDFSLVLAVHSDRWLHDPQVCKADMANIADLLAGMRIAGGSLLPPEQPWRRQYCPWTLDLTGTEDDRIAQFRRARSRLLPGFALVARDDLLESRLADLRRTEPSSTLVEAWLSLSRINWHYQKSGHEAGKGKWAHDRTNLGWVVPIAVGYGALGPVLPAGTVANTRDCRTPFRFVESLYSIGQWISPHRLQSAQQILWYSDACPNEGLYRCRNDFATTRGTSEPSGNFVFDLD